MVRPSIEKIFKNGENFEFRGLKKPNKICEKKGHKHSEERIVNNGSYVQGTCSRCGDAYRRNLTSKEEKRYLKAMNSPMTI